MAKRKSRVEPEDIFLDALNEIPPEFLACREMTHPWRVTSSFRLVDTDMEDRYPRGGHAQFAERRLTCQRCGMLRSDAFAISTTHNGHTALHKISSQYAAPEGYAIQGAGNTRGMRDLLYGAAFEAAQESTASRRRKRVA